ncbi:MAG TPA: sigma 54-interacting transcriptional regulator [Myxococcota bacterium]|nr:sigma 54-interacting transcriptional regulator [Myxococcota bacterium]
MDPNFVDSILDSVADGVFTVDLDWRITSWNRAAHRITGIPRDQALGRRCREVLRTDVCAEDCPLRATIETGREAVGVPVTMRARDGGDRRVSISTAVLRDAEGRCSGGVETFRDLSEIESLRRQIEEKFRFGDIVTKSHRLQEILALLPDIARAESTVLIEGPSGSGKELVARALHTHSPRSNRPFVAINCGALPDTLLESELFGHKAGAFTDARHDREGLVASARGGTLFLDEIGELSHALQVKILRFLQEREYIPLGGSRAVRADVRVIAATNRDLRQAMAIGHFREDLYFRLNVVRIQIPALRERPEDIPLLARHFIARFRARTGRDVHDISTEALGALMRYDFPGNVRELENAIEHAFVLCRGPRIDLCCLPSEIALAGSPPSNGRSAGDAFAEAEATVIRKALAANNGHRVRTAAALGIHKSTLLRKMARLGIRTP